MNPQRIADRAARPTLCPECGKTDYNAYRAARGLSPMPAHWAGCSKGRAPYVSRGSRA